MSAKKILIVDDHAITRKGTEQLVRTTFPNFEITEASTGTEAITMCEEVVPDVILMDYSMPEMNGIEATVEILRTHKKVKIILVTMFDTKPIITNFIKMGGKGFIWKGNPPRDICDGIRVVCSGEHFISSRYEKEIGEWMKNDTIQKVPKLKFTPLELSIVKNLLKGKTSREISEELHLSCRTIETYRYDLIRKTNVRNSVELIEYVFRNGIAS